MRRFISLSQQHALPLSALCLAITLACGGNSSSSSDSNDGGSSGGSDGSGTATASAGGVTGGGDGGDMGGDSASVNTSSGGSATRTGGTNAGGDSAATSGGTAGSSGSETGGNGGAGGLAGSGGTSSTGAVGTLGEPCDAPGQLACAGHNQKLTLVCGSSGDWETNETCGEAEFCDTAEGANAGICRMPTGACSERTTDDQFCLEGDVHTCAPDGLDPTLKEDCVIRCESGSCINDSEPCPEGNVINCDAACGDTTACSREITDVVLQDIGDVLVFRTSSYEEAVADDCAIASFALLFGSGYRNVRATVTAPWLVTFDGEGALQCGLQGGSQCDVFLNPDAVWVYTEDPTATPANLVLEYVEPGGTCP